MILWFALFLLVVAISFVLAYQSMSDFQEIPSFAQYGLFLIREPSQLTPHLMESLHEAMVKEDLIVSLERLFKGSQSTLVIFGPRQILAQYAQILHLLELEDYTQVHKEYLAWEVGVKNSHLPSAARWDGLFEKFPLLSDAEQFFWQINLQAKKHQPPHPKVFIGQIRAVLLSQDTKRRQALAESLQNLLTPHFIKIPRPLSSQKLMEFYQQRSWSPDQHHPTLTSGEVIKLMAIPKA